jgi:hypothetical protein
MIQNMQAFPEPIQAPLSAISRKESKNMFRCLSIIVILVASAAAQGKLPFDILKYVPPAGWAEQKDSPNGRVYIKEVGSSFCMISLIKPVDSARSSSENFELSWKAFVAEQLDATAKPTMGQTGTKGGWTAETGVASFQNPSIKGAALMTTFTGNGKLVAVLIVTNTEEFNTDIERFVDNIELPAIAALSQPQAATQSQPAQGASDDRISRLAGRWQRASSGMPAYADPASWGTAGYTKSRYEFKPDGTYIFTERTFRYSSSHIFVVRENGRYGISGDTLSISPAKSTITSYSKAGGTDALGSVVRTQNRPLEKVDYRFTLHYFSGIQEWNLVLMANSPTQRDGPFSNNKTFENAWYYDQKYIDGDLTAARVD